MAKEISLIEGQYSILHNLEAIKCIAGLMVLIDCRLIDNELIPNQLAPAIQLLRINIQNKIDKDYVIYNRSEIAAEADTEVRIGDVISLELPPNSDSY